MDTTTIIIIYTIGLALSLLITWLFTKLSLSAVILPMTLYITAMAYFFIQPQLNDYGVDPVNFYVFGILFSLIIIVNGGMVYLLMKKQRLEALRHQKKKEYRKEIWDKD